ncbi:hypothetical protein NL676_001077 [Syzygium grande]|nr:hypothetical protein NL676_001077 [Syzygium grande]
MGTYALSAGYYDAYYKRAQQVRTIIQKSFKAALDENDILISPAAPSAAYKIVPSGFVDGGPSGLPVGLQMIGAAFDEEKLFMVGHIFEKTLRGRRFVPPIIEDDNVR